MKIVAKFAIRIFCRKIIINKPEALREKGPLLIACNHPNSFLDGIILSTLFKKPLYSLTRGDVFKKTVFRKLLKALHLLPVYRTSEGIKNLASNYDTFEECMGIFKKNGVVIIFSEGKCINEWRLRPLKKGTARLAIASWNENIPLRVLPVGINYSSFRRFGKNVMINFGGIIERKDIDMKQPDGVRHQLFNSLLEQQLRQLVFEIDKSDRKTQQALLEKRPSLAGKLFFVIPAALGYIIHFPIYCPVRCFTRRKASHNDHYDSVMTGILFFAYPVYVLLLTITAYWYTGTWLSFFLLLLFPFTAWSYVQLKPQLDK